MTERQKELKAMSDEEIKEKLKSIEPAYAEARRIYESLEAEKTELLNEYYDR